MSLKWADAIGGKFATRLFARFLLAAALPIAAIAVLSSVHTSRVISEQAFERLYRAASSYGHALYDRLLIAQEQLRIIEQTGDTGTRDLSAESRPFSAVAMFSNAGRRQILFGNASALPENVTGAGFRPSHAAPAVTTGEINDSRPGIYMSRHAENGDGIIVGALNPRHLFGSQEQWPYATQFCVLTADKGLPLFCPALGTEAAMLAQRINESEDSERIVRIQLDDETTWAVHWDLFLPSGFEATSWRIVALQPQSQALAPESAFAWVFPPAVLLAVLSAALIGYNQIRRMNRPLQKLRDGVREVAAGRFQTQVAVDSADEFEELGRAFNSMADQIGRQFHTLETLSEVDRSILASESVDAIVNIVLKRVGRVIQSNLIAILVQDFDIPSRGRLFIIDNDQSSQISEFRIRLTPAQFQHFDHEKTLREFGPTAAEFPNYLSKLAESGAVSAVSIPAEEEKGIRAYLIIAYRHQTSASEQDITEAKTVAARLAVALAAARHTQQLIHQANYDLLTQLPNRQLLMDRLRREIARSDRHDHRFALLFIDLDRFKNVNDTMGHSVGDQLIIKAASRLRKCLREVDAAARWGGDEFVVIAAAVAQPSDVEPVSQHVLDAMSRPYHIDGREYHVGASIGIAVYPTDGANAEQLLQNADAALYKAKELGRGRCIFFEQRINEAIRHRTEMEAALWQAVANDDFSLVYQPQIRLADGRVEGVEALIRWQHAEQGRVSPADFVPLLEEIGAIDIVGKWILRQACHQFRQGFGQGSHIERVAVNVSAQQIWSGNFAETVKQILTETGTPPQALELEITEGVLLSNLDEATRVINELRSMGIRVALDDFGTGYSSLSYLRQLPIDSVKIDRSFLLDIERNSEALAIVEAIIAMIHALGQTVVAEGVETKEQARLLADRHCEFGQGYYFSRPVSAQELTEEYLGDRKRSLSAQSQQK